MIILGYVDPGLGLLLQQAIISALVGAIFYLKKTRNWMLKPFQKVLRPSKKAAPTTGIKQPTPESRQ
jgi:hypothetical protein